MVGYILKGAARLLVYSPLNASPTPPPTAHESEAKKCLLNPTQPLEAALRADPRYESRSAPRPAPRASLRARRVSLRLHLPDPCCWRRMVALPGRGEAEEAAAAAAAMVVVVEDVEEVEEADEEEAAAAGEEAAEDDEAAASPCAGRRRLSPRPGSAVARPDGLLRRGPLLWICETASAACTSGGEKRARTRSSAWALCSCVSSSL